MTGIITMVMFVTSANALFNTNGTNPSNSTSASNTTAASSSTNQAQIQQLQSRIDEYAQREQQYQQALQADQQKLQHATDQVLQIKQLLFELQTRGLIQVQGNGSIMITGRSGN